jgi:hypothetical protein
MCVSPESRSPRSVTSSRAATSGPLPRRSPRPRRQHHRLLCPGNHRRRLHRSGHPRRLHAVWYPEHQRRSVRDLRAAERAKARRRRRQRPRFCRRVRHRRPSTPALCLGREIEFPVGRRAGIVRLWAVQRRHPGWRLRGRQDQRVRLQREVLGSTPGHGRRADCHQPFVDRDLRLRRWREIELRHALLHSRSQRRDRWSIWEDHPGVGQ